VTGKHSEGNAPSAADLSFTYLGAAGWEITDGTTVLFLDPFFSRIRYGGKGFGTSVSPSAPDDKRPVFGPDDELISDTSIIDEHVSRADFILLSHSHFNHCMDMPYIARKTGATVVGSESVTNVARAGGISSEKLITVQGGEDYQFSTLSLRVIRSLHSALAGKCYFESGVIPRDVKFPLRMRDYLEGGTFAYLIRIGGRKVLAFGSMNYIENEIKGIRPDIVLLAAARPRREIYDYSGRAMRALGHPPTVLATHWDVQSFPYGASQDVARNEAMLFSKEITGSSPGTQVVIPEHFETHVLSGSSANVKLHRVGDANSRH
jgi:L-ascorbate metabolism protein UlaG (beta-lactamase superfamily)